MAKDQENTITITKKIASHGSQSIIIVPKCLNSQLKPGMLAEIKINVLEGKDVK